MSRAESGAGPGPSGGRVSAAGRALPSPSEHARHWSLDPQVVFLNHGSFGACPRAVLARQTELRDLIELEPVRFFVELLPGLLEEAHAFAAGLVNADAAGLAHVANATAGVNTVVRSLGFEAGDELLTSTHEYNACNNVLGFAAEQWGARVVVADPPFPLRSVDEYVDAVLGAITDRTRLVLVSHITSPTGLIVPVERIVGECEKRGVDVLVDGAHAPGQVAVDLAALRPAYYTGNFHKWLCAPKGAAFLWVREDRRDAIRPLIVSHGANAVLGERSRFRAEFDYTGTADVTAYLCVRAAAEFLDGLVTHTVPPVRPLRVTGADARDGADRASDRSRDRLHRVARLMAHNRSMALKARAVLCSALGAEPPAPEAMVGSMAAVPIPMPRDGRVMPSARGYHDGLQDRLIERHGIQVPIVPFPPGPTGAAGKMRFVRVSVQAYNSMEQVEYLAECVREELGAGCGG